MSANYFDQLEAELRAAVPRAARDQIGSRSRSRRGRGGRPVGFLRRRTAGPRTASSSPVVVELDLRDHPRQQTNPPRERRLGGVLVAGLSVLITFAIAATALVLVHQNSQRASLTSQTAGLRAHLAVLRRTQRPSDVLPACCHPESALDGQIIPRFSRLVATVSGARFYLVVTRPATPPKLLWSPDLGDQVAIVEIAPHTVAETAGIPAADLNDPSQVTGLAGYAVEIVPDGVARVRWSFANPYGGSDHILKLAARNNVVVGYEPRDVNTQFLQHVTWYRANGTVAPTSLAALHKATAAQEAPKRAQDLHYELTHSYPAPQQLLEKFSIFKITSRTGEQVAHSMTILHPRLSSFSEGMLEASDPAPYEHMDLLALREVLTPSGTILVIPGQQGLCVVLVRPERLTGLIQGGASGCDGAGLVRAESTGVAFSSGGEGQSTTVGIVPDSQHTVIVHTGGRALGNSMGPSRTRTVRPIYGVYVLRSAGPPIRRLRVP
jgi:hypothetical protein